MKKKYLVLAVVAVMACALALFGCSSGGSSSAASSGSASGSSASASSASASSSSTSTSSASASASSASASASASASSAAAGDYKLITDGTLTIATSPDFPPFENLEAGEYVGLDIEIAKEVAKRLNLTPEFKSLQFDAIIPAIAAGGQADMGISGFTVDPDRAKEIDFAKTYYIDDQAVAVMNNSAITEANADAELNKEGVIIAVQSGTSGETYVQENYPNATAQPYGNSTDAFAAMQSGQANAVCTNLAVVQKMLADAYKDAHIVKSIATGEEYAAVVSKDNPELTKAIDSAMADMSADGTLERLLQQYM